MSELDNNLNEISELVFEKMDQLLPEPSDRKYSRLHEAMRYSALAPGKRLRPFLTMMSASLFGVDKVCALQTAAAVEFIHTYSLIHDDLPSMDDDDERRGQPSCHVKFDEATAILAGDALLTLAFEIISDVSTHNSSIVRSNLVSAFAKAAGCRGMLAGQMLDIASETEEMNFNEIINLQRLKTGELFALSCEAGAILGNAAPNLRNLLRCYAYDLGLAFQITDDLLDADSKEVKNTKRTDKSSNKATFISSIGNEKAKEQLKLISSQAVVHLNVFDKKANLLRDLANYVVNRKN